MRTYLQDFFADFEYPERDARELLQAYDRVMDCPEAKAEWETLLSLYDADFHCDIAALRERAKAISKQIPVHAYTLHLLFFVCLSRRTLEYYRERGLSEQLWRDAMLDLRYKLEECREVWGICGSFVVTWFDGFFALDRFALGRLQFELRKLEYPFEKDGVCLPVGAPVINVHIPRTGTPLTPAACDEAFAMAARFYQKELKDAPVAFICHSWLLYPQNEKLMSKGSNTYAFFKRFDIVRSGDHGDDHPDLWRLFDRPFTGSFDCLPYDSSLRRAYVDHLKAGGKSGWGFGVYLYK